MFDVRQQQPLFLQFLSRFRNPLVILLLVASAISAFTGEVANFVIIFAIVLFSVTLDFVQEHRAGKAAERLRQSVSVRAKVVRDGREVETPVADVVPGDLVILSAGDMIPADGLILEARDLFVKQALLTGEPYPVEKRPGSVTSDATDIQDAANAVFMGTSVISGSAKMRVVKTGADTAIGAVADRIQTPAAAIGLRDWHASLWPPHHAPHDPACAVRAVGQRAAAQAMARVVPVCCRARRGLDPGTFADGGVSHPVARRPAHGEEARHRQTLDRPSKISDRWTFCARTRPAR